MTFVGSARSPAPTAKSSSRGTHRYRPLNDYILAVALCQGAALHYVDGTNGIKDIDVWTFCAEHPTITYPPRRLIAARDFGDRKFGQTDRGEASGCGMR